MSVQETLTITLTRGKHRVEHHIDCQILALVKNDEEAAASLLWGEYLIARRDLEVMTQLEQPKTETLAGLRQVRVSELRAKWAIKQQEAAQLSAAITVLASPTTTDDVALSVSEKILNANLGP